MSRYYKVIDNQDPIKQNYFAVVFRRADRVKSKVSIGRWIWLCFIEILFGEEILESLVITSSLSGCPEDEDLEGEYGLPQQLTLHIPSGVFTNMFRSQIIQVLYYKYYLQYLFLDPVTGPYQSSESFTIDVSRIRFRLKKKLLYLVIAFRRVYLLSAFATNICIDMVVYLVSSNIQAAVISALVVESVRRLFKV